LIDGGGCKKECDCECERDVCDVDWGGTHTLGVVKEEAENNKLSEQDSVITEMKKTCAMLTEEELMLLKLSEKKQRIISYRGKKIVTGSRT
jgi:hypothetical protein